MHLIILYGPPAVGKLTIAEALAERTGFKIFENNPTVRAMLPLFDFGTPEFLRTLHRIRLTMFEEVMHSDIKGIIYTFCYDPTIDEKDLTEIISIVEDANGQVHLVQLIAPEAVLLDRVENKSRIERGKVFSQEQLRSMLTTYELFTPYALRDSLTLDTSGCTVKESVERILSVLDKQVIA